MDLQIGVLLIYFQIFKVLGYEWLYALPGSELTTSGPVEIINPNYPCRTPGQDHDTSCQIKPTEQNALIQIRFKDLKLQPGLACSESVYFTKDGHQIQNLRFCNNPDRVTKQERSGYNFTFSSDTDMFLMVYQKSSRSQGGVFWIRVAAMKNDRPTEITVTCQASDQNQKQLPRITSNSCNIPLPTRDPSETTTPTAITVTTTEFNVTTTQDSSGVSLAVVLGTAIGLFFIVIVVMGLICVCRVRQEASKRLEITTSEYSLSAPGSISENTVENTVSTHMYYTYDNGITPNGIEHSERVNQMNVQRVPYEYTKTIEPNGTHGEFGCNGDAVKDDSVATSYENQGSPENASQSSKAGDNTEMATYAVVEKSRKHRMERIEEDLGEEETIMIENGDLYVKTTEKENVVKSYETVMVETETLQ